MTTSQQKPNRKFFYKNSVKWQGQKRGLLESPDRPSFDVATPTEFGGHHGVWSPEDLFVASINACIMTTFLHFASRGKIEVLSYESEAEGVLEKVENDLMFSHVTVNPRIRVKDEYSEEVKRLLTLSEKHCLISNSVKSKVNIVPTIEKGEG